MKRMPVIFAGHGSPMIALEKNELTRTFNRLGNEVIETFGRPKAILSLSAHWHTGKSYVQSSPSPRQLYDMYGFPRELYEVRYELKGFRPLTDRVLSLLPSTEINDDWGIDHGTWTVLSHMFPDASIPVVQLSIDRNCSPRSSYELGQALSPLREEGFLIFISGNIVHNLSRVEWDNEGGSPEADRFDAYITSAVTVRDDEKIISCRDHPDSAYAAPTADHFLPLLYALGAAAGEKPCLFNQVRNLGSISMTGYAFGLSLTKGGK